MVFSVKGTGMDSTGIFLDVVQDLRYFFLGQLPQSALKHLTSHVSTYSRAGFTVLITGHSLGGYLAEVASSRLDLPGMSFDGPGPDTATTKHSGPKRHPDFHALRAEWDAVLGLMWPPRYNLNVPVCLMGHFGHDMPGMVEHVKGIKDYENITNRNIYSYASSDSRRRRASFHLHPNGICDDNAPCPRVLPKCANSDACLQKKWGWGSGYHCDEGSAKKWCSDESWSPDMLECCAPLCREHGYDVSLAPCKFD